MGYFLSLFLTINEAKAKELNCSCSTALTAMAMQWSIDIEARGKNSIPFRPFTVHSSKNNELNEFI
jgi:hypothetical protein